MRYLIIFVCLFYFQVLPLLGQSSFSRFLKNGRHGIVLSSNTALLGSPIDFRPGLGLGYGYFAENYNFKSLIEYSRWSLPKDNFTLGNFRFNFRYEYERYLNNWFSLSGFLTPDFRYVEDFYGNDNQNNTSEVTYAVALGISPKIYHVFKQYYFSLGLDLPFWETGYFQEDGPDPDISDLQTINAGIKHKIFQSEIRGVATFGYRF